MQDTDKKWKQKMHVWSVETWKICEIIKVHILKEKRTNLFSFDSGAQINECGDDNIKYNRTVDNSVFLNQKEDHTIYTRDYPEEHDETNEPIYPKNFGEGQLIYNKYKKAIQSEKNVSFLGRLASYKYLDMWMVIKQVMGKLR